MSKTIYAVYDDEQQLFTAIPSLRSSGLKVTNVQSPFPVHGIDEVLGIPHTRMGVVSFLLGCTGFSSPVVYDLNDDGVDEAIISINEYDCAVGFAGESPSEIRSKLISIDFQEHSYQVLDEAPGFKNVFSTPWIGDLDDDGYLDIVHCQYFHRGDLLSFLGMSIKRIDSPIKLRKEVVWGAYMNSNANGLYSIK